MLKSVRVPKQMEPVFIKAEELVAQFFSQVNKDISQGTFEIHGERYILVRAAGMSIDFFETVMNLYRDQGQAEALSVARQILFDVAHSLGKADARNFHERMNLKDPIEKLSAGPVHFAHTGWALVDIFPESKPTPDENYYLIYDHPFSFESDAWKRSGKKTDFPVCIMNAGYSSGWCEECFGIPLISSEIMCQAKGDDACRFIMGHASKIDGYIAGYCRTQPALAKKITKYEIPGFFKRKQLEDSLREERDHNMQSAQTWQDTFDAMTDLVSIHDKDWKLLKVNKAFAEAFKMKPADCIGKECFKYFHRTDEPPAGCPHRITMETGKHAEWEFFEPTMGKYFKISTFPMFNDRGAVVSTVHVARDITEDKKKEKEKNAIQEQLIQADKMATIGEIAAGIAHEINTPLSVILGYQEFMQKKMDPHSPYQDCIAISIEEVEQCRDLIKNFLMYTRPGEWEKNAGKTANLKIVLASALRLLGLHKLTNLNVFQHIEENIPDVVGDEQQIIQVLINIINNAVQSMPAGGDLNITVKHIPGDHSDNGKAGSVEFTISDTGEGIPEENMKKIFDPFFTTKRPGKGTGLGLAICQRIMDISKGRLRVESKVGKGTSIIGELPVRDDI